ncbi:decaprenyl-phosphate phosphoribosyltransferase [uncultured Vibrio sp.]|uniref:decaprenyl-phosphate phosphoribosyltransferase n=1 Tax=uncultured Vibrio sp. TaxID=114054 RepID=UPI00091DD4CF|nr:decaprenyl-phosphate phosphoribosyltransferase [uncultured Vibrio sp.]OIQ25327.1 MAG: decaprenyl-phosphate phosphoribosyltransferase [Vibrio sp. MedPE-SWchi]
MLNNKSLYALLRLMRPKQWVKNVFVLAPLLFSGEFTDIFSINLALSAFLFFCIASSATYILNDYVDIENDKKHPIKSKTRPLASGEVTIKQAGLLAFSLYGFILLSFFVEPYLFIVLLCYLVLNVIYTFYLKHQPVLDIFTIALGFVLRVLSGAVVISVPLSSWMFITTLSLALYLASIKRKQELAKSGDNARSVLKHYSIDLADKYAEMSATSAILFYSLFVMSDKPILVYTIPLVLFGLYRYWYIVDMKDDGESPTDALFSDGLLQVTIISWAFYCFYSLTV